MEGGEFPPVAELIPHRGDLLLLDRVLAHGARGTIVRVAVRGDGWLSRGDGSLPGWLALEYMAQCAAAHEGLLALDEGRSPGGGMLVAVRGLRLDVGGLRAGERLRVKARRVQGRPGLGVLAYACRVDAEVPEIRARAEGRLVVALPERGDPG